MYHQIILRTWPPVVFLTWLNRTIQEYDLQDGRGSRNCILIGNTTHFNTKVTRNRAAQNRTEVVEIIAWNVSCLLVPQPNEPRLTFQAMAESFSLSETGAEITGGGGAAGDWLWRQGNQRALIETPKWIIYGRNTAWWRTEELKGKPSIKCFSEQVHQFRHKSPISYHTSFSLCSLKVLILGFSG